MAGSGAGSGSVSKRYGSTDPDLYLNVTDLQRRLENEEIIVFVSSRAEIRRAKNAAGTTAPASESQLPSPQASPHRNVSADDGMD